jgi:hypothetical protein
VAITYIYCNYKEQSRQTVPNLVSSLLKQLVQDHDVVYNDVKSRYKDHLDKGVHPMCQQILEGLESASERFSKVFIVVDALDECSKETRAELLIALQRLSSTVSLLVTSRDPAQGIHATRHLDIHANGRDVRRYIEGRLPRTRFLKIHVDSDPALQEDIVKAIVGNVKGMLVSYT